MPLWCNHFYPLCFKLFFPCLLRGNVKLTCQIIRVFAVDLKHDQVLCAQTGCPDTVSHPRLETRLVRNGCCYAELAGFCQERCEVVCRKALKLICIEVELPSFVCRTSIRSIEEQGNQH